MCVGLITRIFVKLFFYMRVFLLFVVMCVYVYAFAYVVFAWLCVGARVGGNLLVDVLTIGILANVLRGI